MARAQKYISKKIIPFIYLVMLLSPILLTGFYIGITQVHRMDTQNPTITIDQEGTKLLNNNFRTRERIDENSIMIQNKDGSYTRFNENKESNLISNSKLGTELYDKLADIMLSGLPGRNGKQSVIMIFTPHSSPIERVHVLQSLNWESKITKAFKIIPAYLIEVDLQDILSNLKKIESEAKITGLFIDKQIYLDYMSNTHKPDSASVTTDNWWLDAVGALELAYDGSGINLAILDTGVSDDHNDFIEDKSQSLVHQNFGVDDDGLDPTDKEDLIGHGTHCAGIAGGSGASNSEYMGIAPGANLYNLRLSNSSGEMLSSWLISAIEWSAENDLDVISMSLSVDYNKAYNPVSLAIDNVTSQGVVACASIGNEGPHYLTGGYPGTGIGVISVGAVQQDLDLTSFTSRGPNYQQHSLPHVLAPGYDIIAAEHRGSLISQTERYTNSYVSGSDQYSDYIALSGTSMSCPMVAGAAAILLQAYPELTPEGVKAALMAGAYIPNDHSDKYSVGDNGVGAGIINVSASLTWLAAQPDPYELTQAFSDKIPYAPYDLLKYPGEEQNFNISILSTKNDTQNVDITLPSINGLELSLSDTSLSYTNHSTQFVELSVKVMENATAGRKTGLIYVNKSTSDTIYDTINITIDLEYPAGNIYYDAFHGLNDWYQWSSGYYQMEIYDSMKYLHENGYKLDYNMELWTPDYNGTTDGSIITPDRLSLSDIIVLQTPVLPYSEYEINQLVEFVNNGGSILILGSLNHMINIESVNELMNALNTNIEYKNSNYFAYQDVGIGLVLYTQNITDVNDTSPVFNSGDTYDYWYGALLDVQENANNHIISQIGSYNVAAEYQGENIGRGNVVAFSDYHWLRNDAFSDEMLIESHQDLATQLTDFLHTRDSDLRISANFNTTQSESGDISMYLSVLNASSGSSVATLTNGDTINATITDPSGTTSPIELVNNANGIYFNDSILLGSSDYRPYVISINVSGDSIIEREFKVFRISSSDEVILNNAAVSDNQVDRSPGSSSQISFNGPIGYDEVTSYASITSSSYLNIYNSSSHNMDLSWSVMLGWNKEFIIGDNNSGYCAFYGIANESNFINFKAERNYFRIKNYAPELDEIDSFIIGFEFNETHDDDSIYGIPITANAQNSLIVDADDGVAYEDGQSDFSVATGYFAATSVSSFFQLIYPNTIPNTVLSYSSISDTHQGSFVVPATLEFSGIYGSVDVSQETPTSFKYFSILSLVVRDSEGGSTDMLFLLVVDVPFTVGGLEDYWPVILVVVGIFTLIGILYWRSKKSGSSYGDDYYGETDSYSEYDNYSDGSYSAENYSSNNDSDEKFCMHCGQKISSGSRICPYCGQRQ